MKTYFNIPQQDQRQDSFCDQLLTVVGAANRLGCWDVADYLSNLIANREPYTFDRPTLSNDEYGELFSIEQFADMVSNGLLISSDGSACWATETHHSGGYLNIHRLDFRPKWATHVMWFNK